VLAELEARLEHARVPDRRKILSEIVAFYAAGERFGEESNELFDQLFQRLIKRAETEALVEMSTALAPLRRAPVVTVRQLARHAEAGVAIPILGQSRSLGMPDLIEIAGTCDGDRLRAIADRSLIEPALSAVLVERGTQEVVDVLAANPGARYTEPVFVRLLLRATADSRGRVVLRQPARIVNFVGGFLATCMTADFMSMGAKLQFEAIIHVPQSLGLVLTGVENKSLKCKLAWSQGLRAGVQFIVEKPPLWAMPA
jgi:hypothetical protein